MLRSLLGKHWTVISHDTAPTLSGIVLLPGTERPVCWVPGGKFAVFGPVREAYLLYLGQDRSGTIWMWQRDGVQCMGGVIPEALREVVTRLRFPLSDFFLSCWHEKVTRFPCFLAPHEKNRWDLWIPHIPGAEEGRDLILRLVSNYDAIVSFFGDEQWQFAWWHGLENNRVKRMVLGLQDACVPVVLVLWEKNTYHHQCSLDFLFRLARKEI